MPLVDLRRNAFPSFAEADRDARLDGLSCASVLVLSVLDFNFDLSLLPRPVAPSLSESLLLSLVSASLESGVSGSPSQTSISTQRHPRRRTCPSQEVSQYCTSGKFNGKNFQIAASHVSFSKRMDLQRYTRSPQHHHTADCQSSRCCG